MNASKNELTSLIKQAFEGVGFDLGGYENAADMLVWSQMHGLNSFAVIRNRMPDFAQRKDLANEQLTPEIIETDIANQQQLTIDAKGNSSIVAAGLAFDIAYAEAVNKNVTHVNVLNCRDRQLVIKKLVDCAKRDMFCLAYWFDNENLHVVVNINGKCCPQYSQYSQRQSGTTTELTADNNQSLFIVCAKNETEIQDHIACHLPNLSVYKATVISPAMMAASYQNTITQGIEITPEFWQELAKLGTNVLVESTEQSRMGAGA